MGDGWYLAIFIALIVLLSLAIVLYGKYFAEEDESHDWDDDYGCCGGGVQEEWR